MTTSYFFRSSFLLFFLSLTFSSLAQKKETPKKEEFYQGKYKRMVEIDMSGLFGGYPGGALIYRREAENKRSRFIAMDKIKYWRLGFSAGGYIENQKNKSAQPAINVPNTNFSSNYVGISVGRETMFTIDRFNLYYAVDFFLNYNYYDFTYSSGSALNIQGNIYILYYPNNNNGFGRIGNEISNFAGAGLSLSFGARYYFHERFSLSLQSTPIYFNGGYRWGRNYGLFEPTSYRVHVFQFGQDWLSSLGLTYHF